MKYLPHPVGSVVKINDEIHIIDEHTRSGDSWKYCTHISAWHQHDIITVLNPPSLESFKLIEEFKDLDSGGIINEDDFFKDDNYQEWDDDAYDKAYEKIFTPLMDRLRALAE